jgi:dihydroxyacetone kinase-like protein
VNGPALVSLIAAALPRLAAAEEELRSLDAALGDGDLGITVRKGAEAVGAAVTALPEPTPAAVLRAAGSAFAAANPSTMAALVGGGLLAAAKTVGEAPDVDRTTAVSIGRAAADRIAARGKAGPGDKTVLDALLPSLQTLQDSQDDDATALQQMIAAAQRGVDETAPLVSQRGRAAWVGDRGAGSPDPGATAYVRLLQSLAASWPTS